jgi:hypothetical protein
MRHPELLESRATNAIIEAKLNRARLAESMQQLSETCDAVCYAKRAFRPGGDRDPIHPSISLTARIETERAASATFWEFVNRCATRRNRAAGWYWRKSDAFGAVLAESPLFDLFQDCFGHAQEHGFKSGFGPTNFKME